jgi:hypothetical protein
MILKIRYDLKIEYNFKVGHYFDNLKCVIVKIVIVSMSGRLEYVMVKTVSLSMS